MSAGGTGRTNRVVPLYREIAGLAAWAATAKTWTGNRIGTVMIVSVTTADQLRTAVPLIVATGGAAETGAVAVRDGERGRRGRGGMVSLWVPMPIEASAPMPIEAMPIEASVPLPIETRMLAQVMRIGTGLVTTAPITHIAPTQTRPEVRASQPRGH